MKQRAPARPIVSLVVVALVVLAGGCNASTTASSTTTTTTTTPPATVEPGAMITGDTPCPAADGSSRRVIQFEKAPPRCIDLEKRYLMTVETARGSFTITLEPKRAPNNVNNFVVLARYHYFDGLPFDQVAPDEYFGGGVHPPPARSDPGYRLPSELPADPADYKVPGTVIIDTENSGADGSLYYVLLTAKGVAPRFTIIGTVTDGLATSATAIDRAGRPPDQGSTPVIMERVTITEI